ncbi:unnamed protein product [Colias eurytheme]|nr:unnamed protein product [Colias eurytheme]
MNNDVSSANVRRPSPCGDGRYGSLEMEVRVLGDLVPAAGAPRLCKALHVRVLRSAACERAAAGAGRGERGVSPPARRHRQLAAARRSLRVSRRALLVDVGRARLSLRTLRRVAPDPRCVDFRVRTGARGCVRDGHDRGPSAVL